TSNLAAAAVTPCSPAYSSTSAFCDGVYRFTTRRLEDDDARGGFALTFGFAFAHALGFASAPLDLRGGVCATAPRLRFRSRASDAHRLTQLAAIPCFLAAAHTPISAASRMAAWRSALVYCRRVRVLILTSSSRATTPGRPEFQPARRMVRWSPTADTT